MGEIIEVRAADGHSFSAYRAVPPGPSHGGLVVLQEIFGVNQHIRGVCDKFAASGYLAVAPALFDRVRPGIELAYQQTDIVQGRDIRLAVPLEGALADIAASAVIAGAGGKVGVVGYCWGGLLSWIAAARIAPLAAAVGYYGGGIANYLDDKPAIPTLLHFGESDHAIPLTEVDQIRERHPNVTVLTYPAGHGFNCDARASYDAASADLALGRTLEFFGRHLGVAGR